MSSFKIVLLLLLASLHSIILRCIYLTPLHTSLQIGEYIDKNVNWRYINTFFFSILTFKLTLEVQAAIKKKK